MKTKNTTITIKGSTWLMLNKRKRVTESFDDLLNRMCLEEPELDE